MNLGEAPSVANFGERWPLACFCASKPLFWLITWWRFRIWCGGKPIYGGAPFYRRFPVKVASSPLCAANPPGLVRVVFWLCRQVVFWLCRQIVFLAVSLGCFLAVSPGCFLAVSPGCFLAVSPGCFLAVSPGCFLAVSPGLFSGCVARLFSGCVARLFSGCVARLFFWLVLPGFVFWRSSVSHSPGQGQFKYRASQLARGYREIVLF